ncbi:hypothetical protein, partial [Nostoc sp. PCC 9305]|uniref:hypothetical protein n=1 Tax=Nostoc sp. PCC 9305 TaxID=296636 RepID=UPI0039C5EA32
NFKYFVCLLRKMRVMDSRLRGYGVHTSQKKFDFPLFYRLSRTQALHGNALRGGSASNLALSL